MVGPLRAPYLSTTTKRLTSKGRPARGSGADPGVLRISELVTGGNTITSRDWGECTGGALQIRALGIRALGSARGINKLRARARGVFTPL